jgi:tocopherol cyclase
VARLFALLSILLAFAAMLACDADTDDPYEDTHSVAIDWPSDDPNRFHWDGLTDPFFEGWFFQVAIPHGPAFAFLYAVRNPGQSPGADGQAFVVAAVQGVFLQQAYGADDFFGSRKALSIDIGGSTADTGHLRGQVEEDGESASWDIRYDALETWDDTMGALTNFPLLPVNWYVGALRARASGSITWRGKRYEFEDAKLFQDHNWGDHFPDSYVWMQSQSFDTPGDAIALSGGDVAGGAGMLVWRRGDELIEARSQDLDARFVFEPDPENHAVAVTVSKGVWRYVVTGMLDGPIVLLPAPRPEGFVPYTHMALDGCIRIETFERVGSQWFPREEVWTETAAVEIGGAYWPAEGQ